MSKPGKQLLIPYFDVTMLAKVSHRYRYLCVSRRSVGPGPALVSSQFPDAVRRLVPDPRGVPRDVRPLALRRDAGAARLRRRLPRSLRQGEQDGTVVSGDRPAGPTDRRRPTTTLSLPRVLSAA